MRSRARTKKLEGDRVYFPALDVLRIVLFVAVFCRHTLFTNRPLYVPLDAWWVPLYDSALKSFAYAVPFFFVISSFLLTKLMLDERARTGRLDIRAYYVRRTLRIWPLYFLVLLLVSVDGLTYREPMNPIWIARFAAFAGNYWMAFPDLTQPLPPISIVPLWSVCVEEQFYLVWPWVVRRITQRGLVVFSLTLVGVALLFRVFLKLAGYDTGWTVWFLPFGHLDCIGFGALAALAYDRRRARVSSFGFTAANLLLLVLVVWYQHALGGLLTGLRSFTLAGGLAYTPLALVMAWVVYLGASGGARLGRFWSGSVPAYLGKISYGLYAYHGLVFGLVAGRWVYMMPQGPIRIPLMLTITLIVAIVSYEFYERPFLRLKNRFQAVPSGAAC